MFGEARRNQRLSQDLSVVSAALLYSTVGGWVCAHATYLKILSPWPKMTQRDSDSYYVLGTIVSSGKDVKFMQSPLRSQALLLQ